MSACLTTLFHYSMHTFRKRNTIAMLHLDKNIGAKVIALVFNKSMEMLQDWLCRSIAGDMAPIFVTLSVVHILCDHVYVTIHL